MYNWYQNIFHVIAVLIVFHAANEKNRKKKILKKDSKSRMKIKTLLSSPIHLAHHRSAIVPLSLRRCRSVVALMSHRYRTGIAPLSLRFCCSCCRYTVAPLSHRYRATVAPLLSLLLSIRSRTSIEPLWRRCRTAIAPAQRGYK